METIINNPGLQHLAEKIFWNLDVEHLKICGLINQSSQQIFDMPMFQNPMFWLRKFNGLSMKNQSDWANVIQSARRTNSFGRKYAIISYLRWNLRKSAMMDLPCYTSCLVQNDFRKRIMEICRKSRWDIADEDTEIIKILAPLTHNLNTTPIHEAAQNGHTEIVKILIPLTGKLLLTSCFRISCSLLSKA